MKTSGHDTVTAADLSLEVSRRNSMSREKPVIAGYDLHEVLGSGAFGQVYRAVQQSTEQVVAVKVLYSVTDGFREEVRRLSQVSDHPHIVTLVDADLSCEPPYLVTPYLKGALTDRVPDPGASVDIPQITRWFEEIARALQFVHGRGILHCDLKPANILLGEDEQPRLVDFGQSVALQGEEIRLGSFWYMPWQQAALPGGSTEAPQVGWDIYALGATIYVLLTGRLPRADEAVRETLSTMNTGREKVEHYREFVREARLVPIRELNPSVDPELAAIVERCLHNSPEPGYHSAGEILAELWRRRENLPVNAIPRTRRYVFSRFVSRHRLSVTVASIAMGILLLGSGWAYYQIYQARLARQALVVQQYERGRKLLHHGQASGLVWLAEAYRQQPEDEYRRGLQEQLSRQLEIADPALYKLRLFTAPSPSGTKGIVKDPAYGDERVVIDLTDGSTEPLPREITSLNLNQKDTVRYRLDGVVLDPEKGRGGPATWRLPPFDSVSPVDHEASLAILVRPDLVLQAKRSGRSFQIFDSQRRLLFTAESDSFSPSAPTFSNDGDLVVGWENQRVELYPRENDWKPRLLDTGFSSELLTFSPKGDRIAGHDGLSRVRVWDRQGKVLADFELPGPANEMTFDAEGDLLVTVTRNALIHGYRIEAGEEAWAPAEMEKAALWVMIQPNGQIVTMSDEATVWRVPGPRTEELLTIEQLTRQLKRVTGWVYDEEAQVRTLTRGEYERLSVE